jgi:hypothetical protein
MMEAGRFRNAVIAELAAPKYIVEQSGEIAFLAATMRPAHAAALRAIGRDKSCRTRPIRVLKQFGRTSWASR